MAIAKFAQIGDKLDGIQDKLDSISDAFENPLESLTDSLLGGFEIPDIGLPGGLGDLLGKIPSFPGLNIGFGGLGGFGDCFRNIDDLIADMLKQKIIELTLSIPAGLAAASLISTVSAVTEVIQETIDDIKSLSQESLMDLIVKVQNSSFLQRIIIIKQITDLYGEVLCNLNALIEKILDLDPCNLLDEIAGTGPAPGPKPIQMPEVDMPAYPTIIDPATTNETLLAIKDGFVNAKFNIGEALSKTANINDPNVPPFVQTTSHNAALSTLHHLAHSFRNQVRSLGSGQSSLALSNIRSSRERIVREKASEWTAEALEFFEKKFDNHLSPALEQSASEFENFDLAVIDPVAASQLPIEPLETTYVEAPEEKCEPKEGEEPPPSRPDGLVEQSKSVSEAPRKTYVMETPADVFADLDQTIVVPEGGPFSGTYTKVQGSIYRNNETKGIQTYSDLQNMIAGAERLNRINAQRAAAGQPLRGQG